jgi:hypothetical protein
VIVSQLFLNLYTVVLASFSYSKNEDALYNSQDVGGRMVTSITCKEKENTNR